MLLATILIVITQQKPLELVSEGIASYYTIESSSRLTASGDEMFDDQMTCAMKTGKFHQRLYVVSDDGVVVVRRNDRGPYIRGRVIDLTLKAMRAMTNKDLIQVRVYKPRG
jgi:rare lipoprotein A